ncbi:large conductance mechanosensitive channel protein MscL [Persicobacter psychrovividus]|uniref:Large-conductance mechanosensitive channel n=1 Tax=Persicobacter psychrovividus TaxID=387638 RepID=A0ABN6LCR1_9BACT|nr:large-conductance mechanosensitive channel [Persicobacter psychrovividus]
MGLLKEFKEFAIKGNMIDIAIGVIIGQAFNKVVDVLVKEIMLPPLSYITEGIDWSEYEVVLREAGKAADGSKITEIAIGYGKLIDAGIHFMIIGLSVFFVVKVMNAFRNQSDDPKDGTVKTPKNIELLSEISDLLQEQLKLQKAQRPDGDQKSGPSEK